MLKKIIFAIVLTTVISFLVVALVVNKLQPKNETLFQASPMPTNPAATVQSESAPPQVPLPTEADIIRTFFELINEKRIDEALKMMAPLEGENWRPYLESFKKVTVLEVSKNEFGSFRVLLDVEMEPISAKQPVPYFGYANGQNTKFVVLEKKDDLWKIKGIATGP
ncbi:MAG TPA: hypothetical protein VMW29_01535 [Candidatus Bathyarchaeia archaeon]|nr:hypothetical protein [Candidatus Bathyarchaeia archaeon]